MTSEVVKLIAGKFKYPVTLYYEGNRIFCHFKYNKTLMEEIKAMEGAKWHGFDDPPVKMWSILNSQRNQFQLTYLKGGDPYVRYDLPLVDFKSERPLMKHQIDMVRHGLTRHYCIFACEMRTGKTLAAIEIMEHSGHNDWWYVGPKSAQYGVQLEMEIWKSKIRPRYFTYEELKKTMSSWPKGEKAPRGVIMDESSRIKTPTAQRSQAAAALANGIRSDWGEEGFVIEMSGAPAPKAPTDWWNQCEIACPGFLREGTLAKFKSRLALITMKESLAGGVYPELVTWLDNEKKCAICGKFAEEKCHSAVEVMVGGGHNFKASVNEVHNLYNRLRGLVLVKFKKDCLDLPEMVYRLIECKPSESTLHVAQVISETSARAIEALTLLRELSDGFQYEDVQDGTRPCPGCAGTGESFEFYDPKDPENPIVIEPTEQEDRKLEQRKCKCKLCEGTKEIPKFRRVANQVETPKEEILKNIIDEHEEVGRLVVYAGFQGSVDRCVNIAIAQGWQVIRADGRGWWFSDLENPKGPKELLSIFMSDMENYPRLVFIGEPGAAGMGIDLSASPTTVYWSNDFSAENRIQSEHRIHGPRMNINRGATIIDIVHLPTDRMVLENLKKKRDLQNLSMGELSETMRHLKVGKREF